jgi:hypothetical protein
LQNKPDLNERRHRHSSIEFIDENGGGPGVRLRKRERPKKKGSGV